MATVPAAITSPPPAAEANPSAVDLPEEESEELQELMPSTNCSSITYPPEELKTLPPGLGMEANPSAVDLPEEEEPEELYELMPRTNCSPNSPPQELQTQPPAVPSPPPFINSIAELRDLSSSIAAFHECYEDLHDHLDSIKAAILLKLPSETLDTTPLAPSTVDITPLANSIVDNTPSSTAMDISAFPPSSSPHGTLSEEKIQDPNLPQSELEGLCKTMCSRGIRRYIVAHLSDLSKLREELPKVLRLAPNPPKLALECLGKFFLQGTKAFTKNSPMVPSREASIFVLECFLLMNGTDDGVSAIEKSVREEAETAALAWQKRLVTEGGLGKANQIDARGLLLLIACFGIPKSFKREDIRDLVVAAKAKTFVDALKKSQLLMDKIPEVVEWMMKNKMKVDAVDIVYTFGLDERFDPQIILISYLQESTESLKRPKKVSQGSAESALNEANKKQLDSLKSVRWCLQRHKIDPSKLLPGWQIVEKISTLEKEISALTKKDEKIHQKRKANESQTPNKSKTKEAKRSRYTANQRSSPRQHATLRTHAINYSAPPSVIYGGPGAGLLPESMIMTNPYAGGVHGDVLVDSAGQVLNRSQGYLYDSALVEKYVNQPLVGLTGLYRGSGSSGGGPKSPSVGHGSRSSVPDLYQFADSVVEREYGSWGGI